MPAQEIRPSPNPPNVNPPIAIPPNAKPPARRIGRRKKILLQQAAKEFLRQVLSLMHVAHPAPHVAVKRQPVFAAQLRERLCGLRRDALARRNDEAPLSRLEVVRRRS
jgi:hypothetical protein